MVVAFVLGVLIEVLVNLNYPVLYVPEWFLTVALHGDLII